MGVDNLWQFLSGKYGNAFIKWKTDSQSREPAKVLGCFFQWVLVKNIGVTCQA